MGFYLENNRRPGNLLFIKYRWKYLKYYAITFLEDKILLTLFFSIILKLVLEDNKDIKSLLINSKQSHSCFY